MERVPHWQQGRAVEDHDVVDLDNLLEKLAEAGQGEKLGGLGRQVPRRDHRQHRAGRVGGVKTVLVLAARRVELRRLDHVSGIRSLRQPVR